ncbi:MAG TPA: nitrilase-related carbon-nitrogen hydrolase [Candidatus Binatia bacterium]
MQLEIELVAVQPFMRLEDYLDGGAFAAKITALGERIAAARARDAAGRFRHPALVVFPEHIGTFLSAAGYADLLRPGDDVDALLRRVVLRRALRLLAAMLRHRTASPAAAVLLAESAKMQRIYRAAFAAVARRLGATVVAGSIILPDAADDPDAEPFRAHDSRLYNLSYTFGPDGRCVGVTRKVHLVPTLEDTLPLTPGDAAALRPIDTACGRVGVLICYDGFAEPHTEHEPNFQALGARLAASGVEIVAQPSANPWPWNERWVFCAPGEGQLRREQWLHEGLFRQLPTMPGVRYAVNPQLIGDLLGTRFDGRSYIFARDEHGATTILAAAERDDLDAASEQVVVARVAALTGAAARVASA